MMILHILFTLLKIIGILILVILGILLLAVLTVLFVPVRYEGEVGVKNSVSSIRARGTVTWFFRLIRGRFQYKNGKLHYELRILWKKLGNSTVDDKSVKNETVEVENPEKTDLEMLAELEETRDVSEKSVLSDTENVSEDLEEQTDSEQTEERTITENSAQPKDAESISDRNNKETETEKIAESETAKTSESDTESKTQAESVKRSKLVKRTSDTGIEEDRKSTKKEKDSRLAEKKRKPEKKNRKDKKEKSSDKKTSEKTEKGKQIWKRISGIWKKIKYTFRKICDTIEQISDRKEWAEAFLTNEDHKRAFSKALKSLKKLLISLKPGRLNGRVRYGFEDPYYTGKVLAALSVLYPWYGEAFEICPEFEQTCIVGRASVKGKIRVSYFVRSGLGLLLNKSVRRTYRDVKNILDAR